MAIVRKGPLLKIASNLIKVGMITQVKFTTGTLVMDRSVGLDNGFENGGGSHMKTSFEKEKKNLSGDVNAYKEALWVKKKL
jgi:hypothetical protein